MTILAIILLIAVGIIAFLNMGSVPLDLYFTSFELPFWLIIVGLVLIGMVIAGLFAASQGARNRQMLKNKKDELKSAEASRDEEVDRVKKESEAQLEIQQKETEIQRLNERLDSLEKNQSNQASAPSQTTNSGNSSSSQNAEIPTKEVHVEERVVDPSKIKKTKR